MMGSMPSSHKCGLRDLTGPIVVGAGGVHRAFAPQDPEHFAIGLAVSATWPGLTAPTWRCAIVEGVMQLEGTSHSLHEWEMSFFDHEQSATMAPDRATLSVTRS